MALGTNYARNPTPRQVRQVFLRQAADAIGRGQAKDDFVAAFKPDARQWASGIFDEALANPQRFERPTRKFEIILTGHDRVAGKDSMSTKTHVLRDLRSAKAKALAEAKFYAGSHFEGVAVEIRDGEGTSLGRYAAGEDGKFHWRDAEERALGMVL